MPPTDWGTRDQPMVEPNRRSNPKQVFDVAKPNKSRPSNTAKPVIVTNRPILQDPMVNSVPSNGEPTTAPPLSIKLPAKIHIEPLSSSAELANAGEPMGVKNLDADAALSLDATSPISEHLDKARAEAAENAKLAESSEPAENSEPETVPEPEISPAADAVTSPEEPKVDAPTDMPAKTTTETAFKSGTAPLSDGPKDGALVTEKDLADEEDEDDEYAKNIQKLVTEKRYFLPINTQEKRRTKHFIILGVVLILLLAAVWADIALDAGLIHLDGVRPLTHLFSN